MKIKTRDVLKTIAAGSIILSLAVAPSLPMILAGAVKLWKDVNRQDLGRIIKRLKKQEMIFIKERNNNIEIEITEKGRKRLLEYDFENIKIKAKRRDGRWRLIIFDIPEGKKANREMFRKKLVQLGCVRLQDSVFASAFPCKDEIDFLSNYLEISNFVSLIVVSDIERGEELIFTKYRDWDNELL